MANLAKNTKFYVGDNAMSEVFTAVTGVTSLVWSGVTWAQEDTTSNDNATPVKTTAPTLYTNGDVTLTIIWDGSNDQHTLLRTESTDPAFRNFQMEQVNSGEKVQFQGHVDSFAYVTDVSGLLKAKIKVTVNGAFTTL